MHYDKKHGAIHKSIEALDRMGMDIIETGDAESFKKYLLETENTICGRHPISVFLHVSASTSAFSLNLNLTKLIMNKKSDDFFCLLKFVFVDARFKFINLVAKSYDNIEANKCFVLTLYTKLIMSENDS